MAINFYNQFNGCRFTSANMASRGDDRMSSYTPTLEPLHTSHVTRSIFKLLMFIPDKLPSRLPMVNIWLIILIGISKFFDQP